MTIKTDLGSIVISNDVIANIAGNAATNCFGVKGMAVRSVTDGIDFLLRRDSVNRGVKIREEADGGIAISLYIAALHGVNINTVCRSVISEVRYNVEKLTGIDVNNVDICVEAIKPE